jgi:hypothetical protein
MQKFWTTLVWLWVHYSPWLVASLLPSLIAGLVISPKTEKAASVLQKILDILKKIIGFFSILTHKNDPGTFQLPFYLGKLKKPKVVPPAATILLIICVSLPQLSCCKVFGLCGDTAKDLIDCAKEAIVSKTPHLIPIVKDILTGSGDWKTSLFDLIKEWGKDAVACAMQQVGQDLLASVPPGAEPSTPEQSAALEGVKRKREFEADQKWQFKK